MRYFPGSLVDIEYYLPENVLKNDFFKLNFPDWRVEQTEKKTGVLERRIARENETAYDLSLVAVKKLLANHLCLTEKIDTIIYCTQSPDYLMPSNAFLLQRDLKLPNVKIAYDYNLACSGYVYGLMMASSYFKMGLAKNILLVTADTYSKYLDENDRATRMLFGDGASASWLSNDNISVTPIFKEFCDFEFGLDAGGWDKFIVKAGAHREPVAQKINDLSTDKIYMNGIQVVNFVNHQVAKHMLNVLEKNNLFVDDIEQFFVHQASGLAIESIQKKLKISNGQIFKNIERVGNTVSSSLPILIKDYFTHNESRSAKCFLVCGFGVGFSWGSLIAKN